MLSTSQIWSLWKRAEKKAIKAPVDIMSIAIQITQQTWRKAAMVRGEGNLNQNLKDLHKVSTLFHTIGLI